MTRSTSRRQYCLSFPHLQNLWVFFLAAENNLWRKNPQVDSSAAANICRCNKDNNNEEGGADMSLQNFLPFLLQGSRVYVFNFKHSFTAASVHFCNDEFFAATNLRFAATQLQLSSGDKKLHPLRQAKSTTRELDWLIALSTCNT